MDRVVHLDPCRPRGKTPRGNILFGTMQTHMSEQHSLHDENDPKDGPTPFERFLALLLREENPAIVREFALLLVAAQSAAQMPKAEFPATENILLAEREGQYFLRKVGLKKGIRAVTFDFDAPGFPWTVAIDEKQKYTPVLWSKQVAFARTQAQRREAGSLLTSEEMAEFVHILNAQERFEKKGLMFKK